MIEVRRGHRGMFEVLFGLEEMTDALRKYGWVEVTDIDSQKLLEVYDINGRLTVFSPRALASIANASDVILTLARTGHLVKRSAHPMPLRASIDVRRIDHVVFVTDRDDGGRSVTGEIFAVVDHLVRNGHISEDESFVYRKGSENYVGVQVAAGAVRRLIPLLAADPGTAGRLLREKSPSSSMPPQN